MIADYLNLDSVAISRNIKTSDGMGGWTSTVSTTILGKAAIWTSNQTKRIVSDKIALVSTHVLATLPSYYSFTADDEYVIYNSERYRIVGPSDDIMNLGEVVIVPLERVK